MELLNLNDCGIRLRLWLIPKPDSYRVSGLDFFNLYGITHMIREIFELSHAASVTIS